MLAERIEVDGTLLAIYIPKNCRPTGLSFYSNPSDGLQFATYWANRGYKIPSHIHFNRDTIIEKVNEVLYVESGRVLVDLFGDSSSILAQKLMEKGDTIVLLEGGYGFTFLEESSLIYVKQGPYVSKEDDKRLL